MQNDGKYLINTDPRPCPTAGSSQTAQNGLFAGGPDVTIGSVTAARGGELSKTIAVDATTPAFSTSTATLQTTYSPTPFNSTSSASLDNSAPHAALSGGVIFAIALGSIIISIGLPILFVARYFKRSRREKEEDDVLEKLLAVGVVDVRAQKIGLERLQEASERKWVAEDIVETMVNRSLVSYDRERNTKRIRERALEEQRILRRFFEPKGGMIDRNESKRLPDPPVEADRDGMP
ncbi:hypothetical protein EJ02DRAFT_194675 [Clathrospora elynae]|uniref:Uncharacterized protein n=1 Tax=Clathrospora elynae TaxID=706981 RepID=A0A6A5SLS3_9PLEO|nr:hypothetical protein EJ02DRAFT_194675 [Clathrospora elynae]